MNRSKLSGNELTKLKDGLIGVRYPMNPIQAATALDTKINSLMKCDQAKQFSSLAEKYGYNAFREVRGDGNCFFRAVAFITLHSLKSTSFSKCFPQFGKVQLTTCKADSVPKNMKQYYEETVLRRVLYDNWEKYYNKAVTSCDKNYRRGLVKLFNENHYLDFITVLYFRAVCMKYLEENADKYKDFIRDNYEEEICSYSCHSEGVVLNLCSKALNIKIQIFELRDKDICFYQIDNIGAYLMIALLYSDKHYDIIEKNKEIADEEVYVNTEDYYSEVSDELEKGKCYECENVGFVHKDTGICKRCYDISMHSLANFSKSEPRFIYGRCVYCGLSSDVREDVKLCNYCLKKASYSANRISYKGNKVEDNVKKSVLEGQMMETTKKINNNSQMFVKNYKRYVLYKENESVSPANTEKKVGKLCEYCHGPSQDNNICSYCYSKQRTMMRDYCYGCGLFTLIYSYFKLCDRCKKTQSTTYSDKLLNKKQSISRILPKTYYKYTKDYPPKDTTRPTTSNSKTKPTYIECTKCHKQFITSKPYYYQTPFICYFCTNNVELTCLKCLNKVNYLEIISGYCRKCRDNLQVGNKKIKECSVCRNENGLTLASDGSYICIRCMSLSGRCTRKCSFCDRKGEFEIGMLYKPKEIVCDVCFKKLNRYNRLKTCDMCRRTVLLSDHIYQYPKIFCLDCFKQPKSRYY